MSINIKMKTYEAKKFQKPEWLSERQFSEHIKLYEGYAKKLAEIKQKLANARKEEANASYSDYRELKIEEGFCINAIILHEAYFSVLQNKISADVKKKIILEFGSMESFAAELKASALSARGWVVLAETEKGLEIFISDMHNQGGIWNAKPLLVLDIYEHAFFIDFGTAKKDYIEKFIQNIF
jgi:Fe-Mn family superoxide dismutase